MSYSSLFLHHRLKVIIGAILGMLVFLLVSLFFPWEYSATTRLLVIPSSSLGVDPYTAIKSAERINENLSQVIHTSSFYDRVTKIQAQFNFDPTGLNNLSESDRRDRWAKEVVTEVISGTGILSIKVYNHDKDQAVAWANAIAFVLSTQGYEYTSNNVQIKIVDTALPSRFVARPNFLLVAVLGLIVGGLLGAGYVLNKYD